jgi:hypothetical protein
VDGYARKNLTKFQGLSESAPETHTHNKEQIQKEEISFSILPAKKRTSDIVPKRAIQIKQNTITITAYMRIGKETRTIIGEIGF